MKIKVLISGGREVGGLNTFARNLACGFEEMSIEASIVSPKTLFKMWSHMRDPGVFKIFSTSAVFFAPFARNVVCVAHGFPRMDAQGILKTFAIVVSYVIATKSCKLVAVSQYVSMHLRSIFNIKVHSVIENPLGHNYLSSVNNENSDRKYFTYIGRLHEVKNIGKFFPALIRILDENPGYRVCIAGDGNLRIALKEMTQNDGRFDFVGILDSTEVLLKLRETKVFFSGCGTEALGLSYLEALSQGCSVVMPTSGGGVELFPDLIGSNIFLIPLSFNEEALVRAFNAALNSEPDIFLDMCDFKRFFPANVAAAYLALSDLY